ncbi:hypothetical protein [Capybara microvirus Cap1_SP_109]|nr:hypothetical protein [Capybara microvirus Cap1_SP_109]
MTSDEKGKSTLVDLLTKEDPSLIVEITDGKYDPLDLYTLGSTGLRTAYEVKFRYKLYDTQLIEKVKLDNLLKELLTCGSVYYVVVTYDRVLFFNVRDLLKLTFSYKYLPVDESRKVYKDKLVSFISNEKAERVVFLTK